MGLGLEHVQSEPSHYVSFVCQICNALADMDALVTGKCSHAFCKSCMDGYFDATSSSTCSCPCCGVSMLSDGTASRQPATITGTDICSLSSAQPLAHVCMSKIQISCPHCMTWEGDYGALKDHTDTCTAAATAATQESLASFSSSTASTVPMSGSGVSNMERGRRRARRSSLDLPSKSPVRVNSSSVNKAGRRNSMESLGGYSATKSTEGGPVFTQPSRPDSMDSSHASEQQQQQQHKRSSRSPMPPSNSNNNSSNNNSNNNSNNSSNNNTTNLAEASLLKEKGNAKFNKGDYPDARHYYDQALALVKDMTTLTTVEERTAVASLFCNRGATHGKERNVDGALRDYDAAIRIAPDYPKAYSRKFKVLAAHGKLREAKTLLEAAVVNVPGDKGLIEDLRKTRQIVDGMHNVKKLLQLRNYVEAKQAGNVLMKTTDNIEAVLLSAEADASLGLIDSAMDKCSFVLKNDPASAIGMKTSGYISLLAGNVDVALASLKDSLKLDANNVETKELFRFCRKVQNDLAEGRACIAKSDGNGSRSVLKKAVDCFSSSIDDGSLPTKAPLLCMMRIERSEAELQLMHYQPALSDARLAIEVNPTSIRAWVVKAECYIATGRAVEAREELLVARRCWARGVDRIRDVCSRAVLECKVQEADKEVRAMVAHISIDRVERASRVNTDGLSRSDHRDNRHKTPEKSPKSARRQSMDTVLTDKTATDSKQQRSRPASSRRNSTETGRSTAGRRSSVGDRPATGDRPQSTQRRPAENGRVGSMERRPTENGKTVSVERRPPTENGRSKPDITRSNSSSNGVKPPQKRKPTLSEADARRRVSMI